MESLIFSQIVGLAGFIGYMAGFAGQQFGIIDGKGKLYSIINLVSASLVLISLLDQFNLASAMIQISWIIISTVGLIIRFAKNPRQEKNTYTQQSSLIIGQQ